LIRYSRVCGSYQDFLDRGLLLTKKLLNQGFLLVKLMSSLRKFYGRHHDLYQTKDRVTRTSPKTELNTGAPEVWAVPAPLVTPVTRSLVWYVCFADRCLSFCPFSVGSMCCMFVFDIWILITLSVSSNYSYWYLLLLR
jgi:hypothetical protein